MFKLTIVGGPDKKGSHYMVKDGTNSIGRVDGNDIILSANNVSKRHCVLVVNNNDVTVKDEGSSNGTFVNGVLTKAKKLAPGDRLSVGDFVLELSKVEAVKPKPPSAQIIRFPTNPGMTSSMPMPMPTTPQNTPVGVAEEPQGPIAKAKAFFENYILNYFYNMNETQEWNTIVLGLFVIMTFAAGLSAVYPVLERANEKLSLEGRNRALMLGRQLIDRNTPFVLERVETKLDVAYVEREQGVTGAYLIDMEGRIMAPGRKLNQNLSDPQEAAFSAQARTHIRENEKPFSKLWGETIAVAVPLQVFSSAQGKNVSVATAVVFLDRASVIFDPGTEGLVYIQAILLVAIIASIVYYTVYRLTLRPLDHLNTELDNVLKGGGNSVNRRFKFEEIEPLIDVINAAVQRMDRGGKDGGRTEEFSQEEIDAMVNALKFMGTAAPQTGLALFSKTRELLFVNGKFEEVTGIRADGAIGKPMSAVARDQALVAFTDDALNKAPSAGNDPAGDSLEFSGTDYWIETVQVGNPYGQAKGFIMSVRTKEAA